MAAVRNDDPATGPSQGTVPTIDAHNWTGDVEAQRREGMVFLVLLIVVVALLAPFAVWISLYLSRTLSA